jgi:hypothetical protein
MNVFKEVMVNKNLITKKVIAKDNVPCQVTANC